MRLFRLKKYKTAFALTLVATIILASCTQQPKTEEKEAAEKEKPKNKTVGITISRSQLDAVGIQLGYLEQKNLKSVVKASGQLEVPPQNKAEVTLLMGGVVNQVFVLEGQHVNKGQKLAAIENNQLIQLQQDYMAAQSSLMYATKEYERQKELNEANAGTGKVYQQSQSALQTEQAKVAALSRQLRQVGVSPESASHGRFITQIPVYAPISGTIGKIVIQTGSYAEPARPLMNIIDNSKVHCDLVVYEKDLFKVKAGQHVYFTLTNQNNREITGKIYGVNQSFENESKAIIAHAVIEQAAKSNLIQGMYVSALIDVGQQLATAVPTEAVIKTGGKEYIYYLVKVMEKDKDETAKDKDDKPKPGRKYVFEKAEVVTGVTDLGYTEVRLVTSLPKDVKIVTKGAFYILSSESATGEDEE
ncbi:MULTISPECIES: efflux RND transporter periplasmic adaptor subunit [Mucilaginibacter]|uniref:Efflux RND transporter periplasmic adaptor subunit n=2 Tax=Mucilaginibacter TaxID=423349 RepID=A0A6I4I1D2_9SPHI|nr:MULTISPECIES: efflux RND transporter periplasmic adaptor subunit [Mucilaginibacter]MBB5395011.1 cobalt-zinc-cadmium efflux system membrane fusion protein [Mucilaginibacter sp. AK015]NCD68854.1 efflux RND transporter periplasmic adaptor subunit [Mucilaginibacter agri]QQL50561.1 efflux RND transporter periplasmic adaptor subunit [Mucilaginibacter ginkgonis]